MKLYDTNKKIYFVYMNNFHVLKDYFNSLNLFHYYINIDDINKYFNHKDIFVFGQMWLSEQYEGFYKNTNIFFLNVEKLSENSRLEHILTHIKHNMSIIDYSYSNLLILQNKIKEYKINYNNNLLFLPYQYNSIENFIIENNTNDYEYDVGIINAYISNDDSNSDSIVYKRNIIWEKIQQQNWKYVNIMGWGEERDKIIHNCKIIINVHNFDVFNIFEHIRCDRMIFANKIIISDKSFFQDYLDIKDYVIWEEFDKIIDTTQYILNNFDKYATKKNFIQIINNRKKQYKNTVDKILEYSSSKSYYTS